MVILPTKIKGLDQMNIVETLRTDYQNFPKNQTYSIYAEDVEFQDPLSKFQGIDRYKKMIKFIDTWFRDVKMEVHDLQELNKTIRTKWTLKWIAPLPWQPKMAISGWSELKLNDQGLIAQHIDYWECSRFDVVKQLFS